MEKYTYHGLGYSKVGVLLLMKTAGRMGHPVGVEVTGRLIGDGAMPGAAAVEGGALSLVR